MYHVTLQSLEFLFFILGLLILASIPGVFLAALGDGRCPLPRLPGILQKGSVVSFEALFSLRYIPVRRQWDGKDDP